MSLMKDPVKTLNLLFLVSPPAKNQIMVFLSEMPVS
jgi:hypothetical protein